jgi:nucleoside-diphosphate-sugar epimerase
VLITGCTGLLGTHVAQKFISEGYRVRGLRRTNSEQALPRENTSPIEWVNGDILDIPSLEAAVASVDVVVHAAALVSFSPGEKDQLYKVNVEGTANVVNVCLKQGIKKFCHVSSIAALGRSAAAIAANKELGFQSEIVVDEEAKWEDSPYNSHYAQSKYLAELEVWRGMAEGLNAVVVNPSLILGAGDWNRSSSQVFRYVWQEKPFYTDGQVNWVDVRDVAEIIFLLMEAEVWAKRFILSAGNTSFQHLFYDIADCFHKKWPHIRVSASAAQILWRLEWIRSQLTRKAPLITRETARLAALSLRYDNEKIRRELGFDFRSISDTIQWCCENYQKQLAMNLPA